MHILFSLALLLCSFGPAAHAADLLFAFGADGKAAHIYEASSLTLRATPQVVDGASVAFGLAAPGGGFDRYWVVGRDGVSVLDAKFVEVRRIALPHAALAPLQPAAYAPESHSLLVTAGSRAYRIDTAKESLDTVVETGAELSGVVLPSGSAHAYLVGADGRTVWRMSVETGALDGPTMTLPDAASALSGHRATTPSGLAELDFSLLSDAFFQPGERPSQTLWATASSTGVDVQQRAASADGRWEWSLTQGGSVLRTDAAGQSAPLSAEGSFAALSLVSEPSPMQDAPLLIKESGDGQLVPAGAAFTLQVSGSGGITGGIPLNISAAPSVVICQPAALSGVTTINCTASTNFSVSTQVLITVSASGLANSVVFTIAVVPTGLQNGLTLINGNNQNVASGAEFSFVVRSIQSGLPAAAKQVNVSAIAPGGISCPQARTLSLLGEATFTCTAQPVASTTAVTITLTDGLASATVNLNVLPASGGSGSVIKVSPDPVTVLEGASFNLTVEARNEGAPEADVTLNVNVSGSAVTCPATVVTGPAGRAVVSCQAGQVNQNTTANVTVSRVGGSVTFTVTVANQNVADGLQILAGNNQIVSQNSQFPLPLLVSARTNGIAQNGLQLSVGTTDPAVFCSTPVLTDNDGVGTITCNAGSVAGITNVQIQVTDTLDRGLPTPFSATISPTTVGLASTIEVVTAAPITGAVGGPSTLPLRVRALNNASEAVPGATIYFRSSQDVTFNPAVASTNLSGEATTSVQFGCPAVNAPGTIQIGLTATSTAATVAFQASAGPLEQLQILRGDGQIGSPGARMQTALAIRTADVCGNAVPGTPVAWGVNPGEAAALELVTQVSNIQGEASAVVRPTARGGPFQVLVAAQVDSSIQATFNLTTANVPTFFEKVSGDEQQVPANALTGEPLVVRVLSEQSQPVAGVGVGFTITGGDGVVESQSASTDAMGRGTAIIRAGAMLGPLTVRAHALGQTQDFTLTVIGATPVLTADGFVNAASFRPGLSPGSAASIFAVNITGDVNGILPAPYNPASGFPTELEGVRVLVNGVPAPLLAIVNIAGSEQLNIQVPFETTGNFATVTVENNGSSATLTGIPVFNPQPGVFEVGVEGGTFAAALHADYSLVAPSNPARPGETIQIYLTGMGRLNPPIGTNVEGPIPPALTVVTPEITLDGTLQTVVGSFYAPQLISVYQINATIGPEAAAGNRAMQVTLSGVGSKIVLLPVGPRL